MNKLKDKIKITFFLPLLEIGGTERSTIRLLGALNKEKFRISLLLGKKGGDLLREVPKGVSIVELNVSHLRWALFKLIRYFRREKPDIFISALTHTNIISIIAKLFSQTRTKLIITERSNFSQAAFWAEKIKEKILFRFCFPFLLKLLYPRVDAIICVSRGVANDLSKVIHSSDKIRLIYNPVINDHFYTLAKEPVGHLWFNNPDIPVVLAVGRLVKVKDYPTLLRAFTLICRKEPFRLVILGDGEEEKKLKKNSQKIGLSKNIAFLGCKKNPYKYMAKASVFVLSSLCEGFPNVIVEAMACGVPVISTNCQSGPSEIIENGKNGILVPAGDEKALAEAIHKVLNNFSLRKKLSEEGKKKAQDFLVEKSVKKYEQLFQKVLECKDF